MLARAGTFGRSAFPPVTAVLSRLWEELGTRELWAATGQTLFGWALG
jgi:ABC-type nitrate/sulfonate/bicarbonate transport system permease component